MNSDKIIGAERKPRTDQTVEKAVRPQGIKDKENKTKI